MMTKPWHEYRSAIVKLYINEGRTLQDVRGIMKAKYGFEASVRSYRQHFDLWGVGKYNCKNRDIRRRRAIARHALPSPPRTPMVRIASMVDLDHRDKGRTSPESLTRSSSISSKHSILSEDSPRCPRPSVPSCVDEHAVHYPGGKTRFPHIRGRNAEGLVSGVWGEADLHATLRNSSLFEGVLPSLPINMPNMTSSRGLTKYHPTVYHDVEWDRPPYQLGNTEPECYRLAYSNTVPRCLSDPFPTSPATYPRLGE